MNEQAASLMVTTIADEVAPSVLLEEGDALVILVCSKVGWHYSLRGSRAHAVMALREALEDAQTAEGFVPYDPAKA